MFFLFLGERYDCKGHKDESNQEECIGHLREIGGLENKYAPDDRQEESDKDPGEGPIQVHHIQ